MEAQTREWAEALMVKHDAIQDKIRADIAQVYTEAAQSLFYVEEEMWNTIPEKLYKDDSDIMDELYELNLLPVMCQDKLYEIAADADGIWEADALLWRGR